MKCFQVIRDDIIVGLPIVWGQERPYVAIGSERAVLSNELLETQPGNRLLRCQFEVAASGLVVLNPECEGGNDHHRILLGLTFERDDADLKIFVFGPEPGKLLKQNDYRFENAGRCRSKSTSALLLVNQFGRVEIARRYSDPIRSHSPWLRGGYGPTHRLIYEARPFLELTRQGRLEFSGKPGSGCQALPPA